MKEIKIWKIGIWFGFIYGLLENILGIFDGTFTFYSLEDALETIIAIIIVEIIYVLMFIAIGAVGDLVMKKLMNNTNKDNREE